MSDDDEIIDEYLDNNAEVAVFMGALTLEEFYVRYLRKRGLTKHAIGSTVVGAKYGVEAIGLGLSYAIDGEDGMIAWMEFSNRVYNWDNWTGFGLGYVPVVNELLVVIPNPLELGWAILESGFIAGRDTGFFDYLQDRAEDAWSTATDRLPTWV